MAAIHAQLESLEPDDASYTLSEYDLDDDPATEVHLASIAEKKRLWWRNAVTNTFIIACWFIFSTIISVYNKWMFSAAYYGFPYPLFVTALQMLVQFALAAALRWIWPNKFKPKNTPNKMDYGTKVIPTGIVTSLDIGLSNLSLKTITLSFYTMCKSSSLIFVLLFAFLFRLEVFSFRLVGVILLIFSGVLLMVATETHFILSGFFLVISASASGGLRWSLTQLLLKNRKVGLDNPAATIFWLAPVMAFSLVVVSMIVEGWFVILGSKFFADFWTTMVTAVCLTAPGLIAFAMVMSEFYIIQRAGIVPTSIAGIAKEVTTITISAWIFGDELTPLNITGVAITVCGIGLFTYHKYVKSLESTVPLDAHGNPVTTEYDDNDGEIDRDEGYLELDRRTRSARRRMSLSDAEHDDDDVDTGRILFNDGDDDAEELRSIRSSKVRWAIGANMDKNRADEEALLGDPEGGAELVVVDQNSDPSSEHS